MSILIRSQGTRKWEVVESAGYTKEDELQRLLSESPSLIPVEEIRPGTAPFVVAVREFGLPGSGQTDLLLFNESGEIALVECKLAYNAEIKRRVIGQILEYGAYLWRMPYEEVDRRVQARANRPLAELVAEAVANPDWQEGTFRQHVEDVLAEGSFVLVIAVDEVNEEMAKTIEFLNGCGSPSFSFHALEMPRFKAQGAEILVPRLHGTQVAQTHRTSGRKQWTEGMFLAGIKDLPAEEVAVIQTLYDWSREHADWIGFGTGAQTGSFTFYYLRDGKRISVFTLYTTGGLVLNYGMLDQLVEEAVAKWFRQQIKAIPSFRQLPEGKAQSPSTKVGLALVGQEGAIEEFEKAVLELGERIKTLST